MKITYLNEIPIPKPTTLVQVYLIISEARQKLLTEFDDLTDPDQGCKATSQAYQNITDTQYMLEKHMDWTELAACGAKIAAIKAFRAQFNTGLKDSKDFVERFMCLIQPLPKE